MKAYHNDSDLKTLLVKRYQEHQRLDQFVQGDYWDGTKGCLVGCGAHRDFQEEEAPHDALEREFGIPWLVSWLADDIFEGLSVEDSKTFPLEFAKAIPVGADLSKVYDQFCAWMLGDKEHGLVARTVAEDEPTEFDWDTAARDNWSARAAWSAWSAQGDWSALEAWVARDAGFFRTS